MKNVIRLGSISSVNYEKGCADVVFDEEDGRVKTDLPFFSNEYMMPSTGDMVVVIFQMFLNGEQGYILGPVFNELNCPERFGKRVFFKRFSDTAFIDYDAESDTLTIAAGKVVVKNLSAES